MQIHNHQEISTPATAQPLGIAPAEQGRTPAKVPDGSVRDCAGHGDQVQFSALAQQLAAGNASKLGQLQSAIDAGTYTISPSNIAKSIINQSMGD
jgi:anti-sigma28 factor (negative regulator of flagellin synthesis)